MNINKKDLKIETMRGTGPGGQHKNKTDSAVRITHIPTGINSYADERSQKHSKRKAIKDLKKKIQNRLKEVNAKNKKSRRDKIIKPGACPIIRTYNYSKGIVIDHKTNKVASLKSILFKGKLDKLH